MELVKKTENVTRVYSDGSVTTTKTNDIQYDIMESGRKVGSASIHNHGFNMSLEVNGTIEENEAVIQRVIALMAQEGASV